MKKIAVLAFIVAVVSGCAHRGVTTDDVLNTRLRDFHNLEIVGCIRYMGNNDPGIRTVYLKGNTASTDCYSVRFGPGGEVTELHTVSCGLVDDLLMSNDCVLGQ